MTSSAARRLHRIVLDRTEFAQMHPTERRTHLLRLVEEEVDPGAAASVLRELEDRIDGLGPLGPLMNDPSVTDIVINGPSDIWVERAAGLEKADVHFLDREELTSFVQRTVGAGGGRIDPAVPIADVRLASGARFHAVLPPIAPQGPLVSIRRFPERWFTLDALAEMRMFVADQELLLRTFVRERRTILLSGATGTGKTTLLNALLAEVPLDERVVTIEETPELRFRTANVASLVVRAPSIEGVGGVAQDELLKAALRMRPDRLIVGEVRGPESLIALASMATGHPGSMATIHASSPESAAERLVALALQGAAAPSEASLRDAVRDAVDVYIHLERRNGRREVADIREA